LRGAKQPKTGKYDGKPEHQHDQERNRDRTVELLEQQYTRSPEIEDHRQCLALLEALSIALRRKPLDVIKQSLDRGCLSIDFYGLAAVFRPKLRKRDGDRALEQRPSFVSVLR
jgi:hypothetical protein